MRRLVRSADLREDQGLSLAELVVTMFLGSLVLVILGTTFASARGATSGVSARTQNTQQERSALNALTKALRAAVSPGTSTTPFCYARPTSVLFYSNNNPGGQPTLMGYSVDANGSLIEQQAPAPTSSTVAPCSTTSFTTTRILARNVVTTGGLLTYNSSPTPSSPNGVALAFVGSPPAVATTNASGDTPDIASIDNIGISLVIQTPSSPVVPPTTVTTQVRLPNYDYQKKST